MDRDGAGLVETLDGGLPPQPHEPERHVSPDGDSWWVTEAAELLFDGVWSLFDF